MSLLAGTALSLAAAGPAAAMTGLGVRSALHHGDAMTLTATAKKDAKTRTCQAGGNERQAGATKATPVVNARDYPVVACEQPPRSHPLLPGTLKQATSSALAALG